jgi:surface antigen Omp85-like protein
MKLAWLACLCFGGLLFAGPEDPELNVNSRYTVETVIVTGDGWTTNVASDRDGKISTGLRKDIVALIGNKLNAGVLDDLGRRLRKEFQARAVTHRVQRGDHPESVRVVFEVASRPTHFDVSVPKFLYASSLGWSGAVEGTLTVQHNGFTLGLVSDGDELAERFTGLRARYENTRLGTDRVRFRFDFDSFHDQWNSATREQLPLSPSAADSTSGLYRTRQNLEPVVSFVIAKPLTLTVGTSFQSFEDEPPLARMEAANAFVTGLQFQQQFEGDVNQQRVEAGYGLRAGSRTLASDYAYARHHWGAHYLFSRGKHQISDDLQAGLISGRAPLYEQFVLGNATFLRGWNKFEIDPWGGNRFVHNSVEYRYRVFQVFYDTGAVWESGQAAIPRHSVGVGLRQSAFFLAIAVPIRDRRLDPIFMVGMNY